MVVDDHDPLISELIGSQLNWLRITIVRAIIIRAGVQWKNHVIFIAAQGLHPVDVWRLPTKFQVIWVMGNRHRHTPILSQTPV